MLLKTKNARTSLVSSAATVDRTRNGFSLIELLMVMAVVGLLLALTAPGMLNMGPSRKGAAIELSGFLERARAKAVSTEGEIFVALANANHPIESQRFRAYAYFMTENGTDRDVPLAARPLRQVSEWLELPRGILFGNASHFSTEDDYPIRTIHDLPNLRNFPVKDRSGLEKTVEFPYLVFAASGQILIPAFPDADGLNLAIIEGILGSDGRGVQPFSDENSSSPGKGELIQISYYTGRANILTD
jgi:prepilin-type N-terminal cleavage/methylation domain-containing protein